MTREFRLRASDLIAVERELCGRSLAAFAKRAWKVLEPATPLKWGWALDAICAHLEAVTRGEIPYLLMNVPPATMKSLLTCVIWPCWEWGPAGMPEKRFLTTAHKQDLALRDNVRSRRLIQSAWYQNRWPLKLMDDQNSKTKYENEKTGTREASAFTTMTGVRGDRVILDDPLSAHSANSEADLKAAELAFTETLPTRVNNEQSAIVVIMQRLHEKDTSGLILSRGLPYVHLCLPMEFEVERRCVTKWFTDPRTQDGELLFPERFGRDAVEALKKTLGSFATAGQLQQRPIPRGGGLFKRSWFKPLDALPTGCKFVRGWDLAASEDETAAATAGALVAEAPDGRIILVDMVKERLGPAGVEALLANTADQDDERFGMVKGSFPQDPAQAGKSQAQAFMRGPLKGHDYHYSPETGSKETRALPLAAQAEAGNVYYLKGKPWVDDFLDEVSSFPNGKFKDQVDAMTRAYGMLLEDEPTGWMLTR